jgi:hypothetical protein
MTYIQLQHPITKDWLRISTDTGRIVGSRRKPYAVPIVALTR